MLYVLVIDRCNDFFRRIWPNLLNSKPEKVSSEFMQHEPEQRKLHNNNAKRPAEPAPSGNNRHITIHRGLYLPCLAILTTKYLHIYTHIHSYPLLIFLQNNGRGQ